MAPLTSDNTSPVADFFCQRSIFITGATGFLGKVLVEKLLRSCPDVHKLYLLIRASKSASPDERLQTYIHGEVFNVLRESRPDFHTKLVAIPGDVLSDGLGISEDNVALLARDVSVVFHSAATVKMDEELRMSLDMNVVGTKRLIALCRRLPAVDAIVHVSTAYANCDRALIAEHVYAPPAEPDQVIAALRGCQRYTVEALTKQLIRGTTAALSRSSCRAESSNDVDDSGRATPDQCESRADYVAPPTFPGNRPNTYTFTKALAEYVVLSEGHGLPVSIARPSIVGAAWKEPVPGWVDNCQGMGGLLLAVGTGALRNLPADANAIMDIIPVDVATNMLICIAVETAKTRQTDDVSVYNCTSGSSGNSVTYGRVVDYTVETWTRNPTERLYRLPGCTFGKNAMVRAYGKLHRALAVLEYFMMRQWIFTQDNIAALREGQTRCDRQTFEIDMRSLDWREYIDAFCLGIKRFVLKEDLSKLPQARKQLQRRVTLYRRFRWMSALVLALFALARLTRRRGRGAATSSAGRPLTGSMSLAVMLFGRAMLQFLRLLKTIVRMTSGALALRSA